MTPAMILIVLIGAVLAWFLLAGIFKVVGGKTKKVMARSSLISERKQNE